MAQKLVIDVDYNVEEAELKAKRLYRELEQQEIKIKGLQDKKNASLREEEAIKEQINKYNKSATNEVEKEINARTTKDLQEQLKAQQQKTAEIASQQNAEIAKQDEKYLKLVRQDEIVEDLKSKQKEITNEVEKSSEAQKESNTQTKKGAGFMDSFTKRVKGLAKRIFIFSLIAKAFRALLNYSKEYLKNDAKMGKTISQLKGNLQVIGTTVMEGLRPAIQYILNLAVKLTSVLGNTLAVILGKNVNEMKSLTKQTKKAGDEAKKASASFDTLQTIDTSSNSEENGASYDFGAIGSFTEDGLAEFATLSGFAMMGLGLLLIAFGHIGIGVTLIAVGALQIYAAAKENPNAVKNILQGQIGAILGIVGGALLVLGVILCCFGQIPLGIACIVAGIGALGITAWANSDSILKWIKGIWKSIKDWWNKDVAVVFTGEFWKKVFSGIKSGLKWALNGCIDFLNFLISGVNNLIKLLILPISLLSKVTGLGINTKAIAIPKIPKLATGAVIPGGSPFLAMLGDQRKGQTNIEAPLETIVQAFMQAQQNQNLTLTIDGNMGAFVKAMNPVLKREQKRSSAF